MNRTLLFLCFLLTQGVFSQQLHEVIGHALWQGMFDHEEDADCIDSFLQGMRDREAEISFPLQVEDMYLLYSTYQLAKQKWLAGIALEKAHSFFSNMETHPHYPPPLSLKELSETYLSAKKAYFYQIAVNAWDHFKHTKNITLHDVILAFNAAKGGHHLTLSSPQIQDLLVDIHYQIYESKSPP
ncbi:MAG: hypothetical protein AB7N99_01255 [Simkaniaceae bacterium]